ncbi:MAG TPA: spore coat U domain-containing protein [Methylibium sp.]|nr:spore coat U domain-containing protein [Methylibium sp.]
MKQSAMKSKQALAAGGLALAAASVQAGSASSTFDVTATVLDTCAISAANLAFGTYAGAVLDSTTTITVACTNLTVYTVEIDAGAGSGATTSVRRMTGPSSALLNYALYQDAARLLVWGTVGALQSVAGIGNGASQSLTVYGRVPSGQSPEAGAYTDTVTVTVNY